MKTSFKFNFKNKLFVHGLDKERQRAFISPHLLLINNRRAYKV